MKAWPWLVGGGVVLAAVAGASGAGGGGALYQGGDMSEGRERFLWELELIPELSPVQRAWADITVAGETQRRYNVNAHNGTPGEVAASVNAVTPAILAWARSCGVSEDDLKTGSWGRYQRLAPYLSWDAKEIWGANGCGLANPTRTRGAFQHVSAFETAHDLQQYKGFQAVPTLGNLRLGWWGPGAMGYLSKNAKRLDKYRATAVGLGYPPSIIEAEIGPFPRNLQAIYARLVAAGVG